MNITITDYGKKHEKILVCNKNNGVVAVLYINKNTGNLHNDSYIL